MAPARRTVHGAPNEGRFGGIGAAYVGLSGVHRGRTRRQAAARDVTLPHVQRLHDGAAERARIRVLSAGHVLQRARGRRNPSAGQAPVVTPPAVAFLDFQAPRIKPINVIPTTGYPAVISMKNSGFASKIISVTMAARATPIPSVSPQPIPAASDGAPVAITRART